MHQAAMSATNSLPPDEHQQIMILIAIEGRLEPEVAVGIGNPGVFDEDPLDQMAIGFCGTHCRIVSVSGSKTINRMRRFSSSSAPIGSSNRLLYTSSSTARNTARSGSARDKTS